jgi:hypothetical protein
MSQILRINYLALSKAQCLFPDFIYYRIILRKDASSRLTVWAGTLVVLWSSTSYQVVRDMPLFVHLDDIATICTLKMATNVCQVW